MRLLTHFVAADVRRSRIAIALWIAIVAVEAAIEQWVVFSPLMAPPPHGETIRLFGWFIWLAGLLLGCALVPLVLQLHPSVGTDAFWMTRPLPARTLVLSKLLLLAAVFVGVRVLIELVVMSVHGVPAKDMALVGVQTMLTRAVVFAGLLVVAVLTPTFARFVLLCVVLLFSLALLPVIVMLLMSLAGATEPPMVVGYLSYGSGVTIPFPQGDEAPAIVGMVLLIAGGVAVAAIQYAARRVRRSVAVAVAAVVIAMMVSSYWPWPLSAAGVAPDWSQSSSSLRLSADAAAIRQERAPAWGETRRLSFNVPVRMTAAPPGWVATVRTLRASFDLGGGQTYSAVTGAYPAALPDPANREALDVALQHTLGVPLVAGERFTIVRPYEAGLRLQLPADVLSRSRSHTGMFAGEFAIDIARLDVAAVLPLARGSFREGAYRIVIHDVRESPLGVALGGRLATVATLFDRRPRPTYWYFLRSSRRGEAVVGSAMSSSGLVPFPAFGGFSVSLGRSFGFSAAPQIISFGGYEPTQVTRVVVDRAWLDGAELVIVRATHEGSIWRRLEIPNFPLAASTAGPPRR